MNKIELLPEHIIDQIKAGEVIEKPSTLIKEILENAIDSGAKNLDLEIHGNGMELISLCDDGQGINVDELELAFSRHATSKIQKFEDIYDLFTYGFRGEALASIASISKVTCQTNQRNAHEGKIKIEGGKVISLSQTKKIKENSGTSLYIKDLFYNTPVRMKFIQSKTSEKNHLTKMIDAFLLTHPQRNFTIKINEGEKEFYKACSMPDRIKEVYSRSKEITLAHYKSKYDQTQFELYVSLQSTKGNAHKQQFLFVNERLIQDIRIQKIILNSLKSLWPENETGNYYAYIKIPPERIDINVHPNKTSIKFFEPAKLQALISQTIKTQSIKNKETKSLKEVQKEFTLKESSGHYEMGNLNYRTHDFTSNQSNESYFKKLHNQESQENLFESNHRLSLIFSKDDMHFYLMEKRLYLINVKKLLLWHFQQFLIEKNTENQSTPLLVSRPLKTGKMVNKEILKILNKKGFEIDSFSEMEYIIRAFPMAFNGLPFYEIIQSIFNSNISTINNNEIINLNMDFNFESLNTYKILNIYPLTKLIENHLAKEISYQLLRNLYEK